ncbi:Not1 N-terminal domain, CCR4-Not complex component-domain-containing protein [Lentinula lateritia]|uniref:Not1 N-terminal domain, CCR4-Not complex component-domain-containing protein n=1 Tax=Lentinula aff. lateritia TaxID=2804960 RepID=A0ACC1TZ78_9AGAR|nr:Not1 N-terminal domain, CCR4-Not complex component-domain-containing protein [Lentinula aff. lateritia]KAJ3857164.1 Not1 N-terminal domain, CCR4-Not complex component-domain-containing protein [Lentinula lateritia]
MAARKLQTEIDRTLKKVGEGVEYFESVYDKMQASSNQTQKEKLELDLKTQIKKLQRMRDQIKTWYASNDIKDKSALVENRKLIETQMEKFKACEKEMKTKAFSKEGLTQAAKLDPKEQEKEEIMAWLQTKVEELQMQIEQAEAEIESLQGSGKKRGKSSSTAGRAEELEHLNDRRKWHISRLEIVLRLLNNGSLFTEKAVALKDDVAYFVESNTEEDFDEYEGIYDELNLDEEEEKFRGLVHDDEDSDESDDASEDLPPRTPNKKHDDESTTSSRHGSSPILKKATTTLRTKAQPITNILKTTVPHPAAVLSAPPPRPAVTLPPIRYAAAAAAAIASVPTPPSATKAAASTNSGPSATPAFSIPTSSSQASQDQASVVPSSPSLTHPSVTSPMLSSAASVSQQFDGSFYSSQESPAMSEAVISSVGAPVATSSPHRTSIARKDSISSPSKAANTTIDAPPLSQSQTNGALQASALNPSPLPQQVQQYSGVPAPSSPAPQSAQAPQFPPGVKVAVNEQSLSVPQQNAPTARPPSVAQQAPRAVPGSLSDLVVSFENAKQKAVHRMNNLDQVHKLLEGGLSNLPQPQDTERPKYYVPRNPFNTPSYYPQMPNPLLNTPAIFAQLDVETLFYVFYYLPGTYQQFLAAKELKRQSWRFHVKYLTWFQRHSEPQAITEEYEQGVYVYFDWEGSWCQRKKADFRFEYRYLSED